jgi:hypothetical protein
LGISLVFAIYFALFEIDKRLGEGGLRTPFFEAPKLVAIRNGTRARQPSETKRSDQ